VYISGSAAKVPPGVDLVIHLPSPLLGGYSPVEGGEATHGKMVDTPVPFVYDTMTLDDTLLKISNVPVRRENSIIMSTNSGLVIQLFPFRDVHALAVNLMY
jgi:hypothetical protein